MNLRDSIAAMAPTDALILDNMFPDTQSVRLRKGAVSHATGFAASVEALLVYNSQTGASRLFAATSAGIWDVTSAGAIGAAAVAKTNGRWQSRNYSNGASSYLLAVNGADAYTAYDGTTWSTPTLTGVTATQLAAIEVYRERLFFLANNSLDLYYLPAGSISGAVSTYPLGRYFKEGGSAVAIGTWTVDSGSGEDDRLVVITSEGEVGVFRGDNPSLTTAWQLVGIYKIGRPLGRRCMVKYGGDLLVLTDEGLWPLSRVMQSSIINRRVAVSANVDAVLGPLAQLFRTNYGWQVEINPFEGQLWVLVPSNPRSVYVMNTSTRAWARWTAWNPICCAQLAGQWYYGDTNRVVKAYTGVSDFDANIDGAALTGFHHFGQRSYNKHWQMVRLRLKTDGAFSYGISGTVDFDQAGIAAAIAGGAGGGAVFNTAQWNAAVWAGGPAPFTEWRTPGVKDGYLLATYVKLVSRAASLEWLATDYMFTRGSPL